MNILILSAGTRNKIVQYFKRTLNGDGKVIATDMSAMAPALYDADAYYLVHRITATGYFDEIIDICKKESVDGVLSLIDPELSLLAANKDRFAAIGVTVIGSGLEQCERSMDKMKMFHWLKDHDYLCAKSYDSLAQFSADESSGQISFPVFVKPICGSASVEIQKVYDMDTLRLLMDRHEGLMIQELLCGQEIGGDVYIDMLTHEVVSIFTKKKLLMRAGETDKAISFKDERLFALIEKFAKESGFLGQIDIDIFDVNGKYYISEVNPRFGGGYPHAYECGVDHMKLICNNLSGIANRPVIGDYEDNVVMMKYNEISVRKEV